MLGIALHNQLVTLRITVHRERIVPPTSIEHKRGTDTVGTPVHGIDACHRPFAESLCTLRRFYGVKADEHTCVRRALCQSDMEVGIQVFLRHPVADDIGCHHTFSDTVGHLRQHIEHTTSPLTITGQDKRTSVIQMLDIILPTALDIFN